METKVCGACKREKTLDNFHKCKGKKQGVKSACKECRKNSYQLNSEHNKTKAREHYLNNSEKIKEYQKQYKKDNRDKINKRERQYKINRRKTDEVYLLKENISCLIRNSLKLYNHKKESKTEHILGISVVEFKDYLNNNPYNFRYQDKDIDLDHIIPISTARTQEEAIKLNHYTNFQLLPKDYNRNIKMDNIFNRAHFNNYLGVLRK
jgi:hypothetical protein